jgi:outer membrane lipoprotein-sorting protein
MHGSNRITGSTFIRSGIKTTDCRRLLAALILLCSKTAFAEFPLDQLMQGFARIDTVQAHFEEQKTLALLETPLVLNGTLTYRAPDYLKKQVDQPRYSLFEIEGNHLRIADGVNERSLSLDRHPAIRAFAEAYRAMLAGDRATLERYYEVWPSGTQANWQLLLVPKDDSAREFIQHIRLSGVGARIDMVETLETSGDLSIMTVFTNVE